MRSHIERMIDEATGFSAPSTNRQWVTMRCPKCNATQQAHLDDVDPAAAATIVYPCPKCHPSMPLAYPEYLDGSGNRLKPSWEE